MERVWSRCGAGVEQVWSRRHAAYQQPRAAYHQPRAAYQYARAAYVHREVTNLVVAVTDVDAGHVDDAGRGPEFFRADTRVFL